MTKKRPTKAGREGRRVLKALCADVGRYRFRAARDDRAGAFPLQKDTKRSVVTLHALRGGQLFHAPPKMPPGVSRPVFRSARVTVVLLPGVSALLASRVEPWDAERSAKPL